MSRFWSRLAAGLTPYVPGEQPRGDRLVKLNTNENPYGPSPRVLEAIAATSADALRRYPDPQSSLLREAFAARVGLAAEQVFVGNGSDEVLAHAFQGLLKHDRALLFPDVTYSFYPVWCALYDLDYRTVALTDEFAIDIDDYPEGSGAILIPNPNAPTGVLLGLEDVRRLLLQHPDSVVVIDEAYIDFGGKSAVTLVPEFENLLVIQTLSKSRSLAGLRVGAAFGHADLVEALVRIKDSFNSYPLDVVAQRAAAASLEDDAWFDQCRARVMKSRERLAAALGSRGFRVLPSAANFLFASHGSRPAAELFRELRERQVIVRYFDRPRINNFLRISIGTEEECDALLAALDEIL